MDTTSVITFLVGAWLLGYLWGTVFNVIMKKWQSWMS
jgi:hypothetical protein